MDQPKRLRVLIVEDDAGLRQLITKRLELLGCQAMPAEHGAQAVDLCTKQGEQFDLIIMDLHMPVMCGQEAIARLRTHPGTQSVPILCISAGGCADGMKAGADHFLSKPFKGEAFKEAIEQTLAMRTIATDISDIDD